METLYTKRHLLKALARAALQHPELHIGTTYMALLNYEKKGIINPASIQIAITDNIRVPRNWRFYTKNEIEGNVQLVIDYKSKKK